MRFILTTLFLLLGTTPLQARSGDMFEDKQWAYQRPAVPSDRLRGEDMFKPLPLMTAGSGDMFAHVKPRRHFSRDDMFPFWKVQEVPYHLLKIDPRNETIERALYIFRS